MKNLFQVGVEEEIIQRIEKLTPETAALWGKMNVSQMMAHCVRPQELAMGEAKAVPVNFIMKLFGKMVKNTILSEKPFKQSLPTDPTFITVNEQVVFEDAKSKLTACIQRFVAKQDTVADFNHPFFGKLSKDEWGSSQYKHLDHHLSQFGV